MLTLALAVPLLSGDVHVDQRHGFQIEVPDGWRKTEQGGDGSVFRVSLLPPGSIGHEGVTVMVGELEEGEDAGSIIEKGKERIRDGGDDYSDFEEWDDEIAGRAARGLRVDFTAPTGQYRIVQSFIIAGGRTYTLQRHAKSDEFDARSEELEGVVDSFALVEISVAALAERELGELAARCGSEVDWAADWEEASARAREQDRLVLVSAFLIPGFDIKDTPRNTVFADPDVIELVNERFVPLWYTKGMPAPFVRSYGMGGSTFGQALMLATPDGDIVLETQEASSTDVAYAFLRAGLERNPDFTGGAVPDSADAVDRARGLVARGELEQALGLLQDTNSGAAHRLRARVLRLLRRGPDALAAVAAARAAGGEPEAALLVEEANVLMRLARDEEAIAALERVLDEFPDGDLAAEARFMLALFDLRARDQESAKRRWRALATERPESRWAWQAAAGLRSTILGLDVRPDFRWPDDAILDALLDFPEPAPLPADRAPEAAEGALAWLLASQRGDGSWPVPATETSKPEGLGPDPFIDSITALATRALIQWSEADGAREAAARGIGYLLATIEEREASPPLVLFMDYQTWSNSMMLHALADAIDADLGDADAITAAAAALVEDLAERQQENGGWSYYVTPDLDGAAAPAQSISFTTAAAVLALARAREAGFEVPADLLDPAVAALEEMRDERGIFAYFLYAGGEAAVGTAAPGAVGRGPACELALAAAGKSTDDRLRGALDLFLEHSHLFSAEQGKALMHAGPHAQGCHYLFFDYAHAALAQASIAPAPKTRVLLLELVLDCRQPDGSFLDTPLMGRAYGTAMALIAIDALRVVGER